MDVYGSGSIELVPAYLILAESSIGLGKLVQAEEYLSQVRKPLLYGRGRICFDSSFLFMKIALMRIRYFLRLVTQSTEQKNQSIVR